MKIRRWLLLAGLICGGAALLAPRGLLIKPKKKSVNEPAVVNMVLSIDDTIGEGYFNEGNDALNKNNLKEALQLFAKASDAGYHKAELYHNIGTTYFIGGKGEEALKFYQKALKMDPNSTETIIQIAQCHMLTKHPEKTVQMLGGLKNKGLAPRGDIDCMIGLAYFRSGNNEKAIECYKSHLGKNPTDYHIWGNLGELYVLMNDETAALEAFNSVPEDAGSIYNISLSKMEEIYVQRGKFTEAVECLSKVKKGISIDNFTIYLINGEASLKTDYYYIAQLKISEYCEKQGKYREAIRPLQNIPKDVPILYEFAQQKIKQINGILTKSLS